MTGYSSVGGRTEDMIPDHREDVNEKGMALPRALACYHLAIKLTDSYNANRKAEMINSRRAQIFDSQATVHWF